MNRAAIAAAATLIACGNRSTELVGDGGGGLPGLQSLDVAPADSMITIDDLAAVHAIDFTATGHFVDGETRDVTADVGWTTDRDDAGTFTSPGHWRATNHGGGVVTVEARSGAIAAGARIEIHVQLEVIDPVFPPPPGGEDPFDPPTPVVTGDPTRSPRILYPAHEVMFPLDLYRVLFQYDVGAVADVLRLRFVSPFLQIDVFTTVDRWQPEAIVWDLLSHTNAGDKVVMTVAGVDSADPTTVWESTPIDVYFSRSAVPGAIYYWSTSSEGVMKGALAQPAPTKFYTEPPDTTCVACHTLSRDGRRLAVGYDGEKLAEVSVPDRATILPAGRDAGWSTFDPTGRQLLIAHHGTLTLLDADTGATIGPDAGQLPITGATHPDWSPLGDQVVVAQCGNAGDNRSVEACSIVRIPYAGGVWGTPEVLVAAAGGMDNNFFPRYSPDGGWIAYVHANGKSKDQPGAELRLIPAAGGAPFTLARANHRVGPLDSVVSIGNTMPTWAPTTHRGTQWIAFSSLREYGVVQVGADQLWVVALDLTRPGDPSYAAFWLPFQDAAERNHRAFWAYDPDQPCGGGAEVCDGFDNDCDGVIDNACVPCAAEEICFDGIDNDCDGVVDGDCIE